MEMTIAKKRRLSEGQHIIPNGLIGMIFLLATEIMFFSGLISSFVVNRAEKPGAWDAPWQHVLPIEQTLLNTIILSLSAVTMMAALWLIYRSKDLKKTQIAIIISLLLGSAFVILQGREWVSLIDYGMTTSSSIFGGFFYIIIGAHALHAVVGILILLYVFKKTKDESLTTDDKALSIMVGSIYWFFVVLLWPVLYYLVYFS